MKTIKMFHSNIRDEYSNQNEELIDNDYLQIS